MTQKFINVGFEFTASVKNTGVITNPGLYKIAVLGRIFLFQETRYVFTSEHKWIHKNYQTDSFGCEIATPIIKKKSDVVRYYNEFMEFANRSNLTANIYEASEGLGGCHIHLDMSWMPNEYKKGFLQNVAVFMTNSPWLNWGFNDPNDNINANSLLCSNFTPDISDCTISPLTNKEKKMKTAFELFVQNPLKTILIKHYAIKCNDEYDTIELRIFDMPTSLEQHLFHYDVAMAIYNTCLQKTMEDKVFLPVFKDIEQFCLLNKKAIIMYLKRSLKEINIIPNDKQMERLIYNIEARYEWSLGKNSRVFIDEEITNKNFFLF